MNGYYKQLVALLLEHNCEKKREAKGSHEMWYSPIKQHHFAVSVTCASRHTANDILKQAGIKKKL